MQVAKMTKEKAGEKAETRTIAYLRVSTDKQEIENQKMAVLEYANKEGFQITEFVEIVISSRKKAQKTHLDKEIEDLKAGDLLVVSELSRVGRSLSQIITFIDELNSRQVRFIAIKENIKLDGKHDTTSKVMITMFGLFAELERDLISQRTKDGLKRAKASGKTLGRPKGTRGKSKLDGKEKKIAELLDKGLNKTNIAKYLEVSRPTLIHFVKTRNLEVGELLKNL